LIVACDVAVSRSVAGHADYGARQWFGALAGGVALVAVIWSLARLRRRAPTARSTCDLVGVALGERASTMVALLHSLFLASEFASATGLVYV
jgi:ethanolamine permease